MELYEMRRNALNQISISDNTQSIHNQSPRLSVEDYNDNHIHNNQIFNHRNNLDTTIKNSEDADHHVPRMFSGIFILL
jgi:hypothetical protein